jgi:predicted pyridoxine 5'-phosphate oxidase superfamily flavin-nucleotide-binding protein
MKDIKNFADIAFTDEVRKVQDEMGSRNQYLSLDTYTMNTTLTPQELEFIEKRDSFYMGSVNLNGFPYVQFRGGPTGFLKVLDEKTLGMIDFNGNKQYISRGNLRENKKTSLFLMNYKERQRLKIWAETEVLSIKELQERGLYEKLHNKDYKTREERGYVFHIKAFDWNYPKHIPRKYTIEEIAQHLGIESLESIDDLSKIINKK